MRGDDGFRAGRRSRVIDFRGRSHELCEVADLPAGSPRMLREAVIRANKHRLGVQLRGAVIAGVILLGFVLLERRLGFFHSASGGLFWPGYLMISLICGLLGGRAQVQGAAQQAMRVRIACEVCPACGYSLRGLEMERDGCRVCPECGGAWGRSGK